MKARRLMLLILISFGLLFTSTGPAAAAVFVVNATFDAVDWNPGDGLCRIGPTQQECTEICPFERRKIP